MYPLYIHNNTKKSCLIKLKLLSLGIIIKTIEIMFEEVEKLLDKMVEDHFDIDEDLTKEEAKGMVAEHIIQYLNQKYIY